MAQPTAPSQNNNQTRFLLLLISLLGLIILEPFISDHVRIKFLVDIFFTLILFTSIYAVSEKKGDATIAILLAIPKLGTTWALSLTDYSLLHLLDALTGIVFIAYIITLILRHIFKQDDVSLETIYGAIVVYLLIGIMWVFLFHLTEYLHPDSFAFTSDMAVHPKKALFYYSFVTLTTLGYGDITPVSEQAKSLAILEAIIGQMYIAVLIARLVGIHISQSLMKK